MREYVRKVTANSAVLFIELWQLNLSYVNGKLTIGAEMCYGDKYEPAPNRIRHLAYKVAGAAIRDFRAANNVPVTVRRRTNCIHTNVCMYESLCMDNACPINNK